MFLLHEYDIFWTFLIIASLIPILVFWISGSVKSLSAGYPAAGISPHLRLSSNSIFAN